MHTISTRATTAFDQAKAPVMAQNDEAEEHPKRDGWHDEEVDHRATSASAHQTLRYARTHEREEQSPVNSSPT